MSSQINLVADYTACFVMRIWRVHRRSTSRYQINWSFSMTRDT